MIKILNIAIILLVSSTLIAQKNTRTPDNYSFVPEGKTYINGEERTVEAFYISNTEISNKEYKEFLEALKNYGDENLLERIKVNHEGWKKLLAESQPFVEFYFENDAYNDYPVVNITKDAAEIYCKYLKHLYKEKYNLNVEFRLPTMEEYIRAAKGETKENTYAWSTNNLLNKKNQAQGNFKTNNNEVTAPVESFDKNQFGLYNMSGNVAEMISKTGVAMGGSWNCDAKNSMVENFILFDASAANVGFRPVMVL